jgi:hypothetical protein
MKERRPASKQRANDKAVIDHLTTGPLRPRRQAANPRTDTKFDEENGRELMEALKKRWTGRNGGLPQF